MILIGQILPQFRYRTLHHVLCMCLHSYPNPPMISIAVSMQERTAVLFLLVQVLGSAACKCVKSGHLIVIIGTAQLG